MTEPVRLSKCVAEQLRCSRREAELYIEGGWIRVDGQVIEAPFYKVQEGVTIELLPGATATEVPPVTLLWHKPAGVDGAEAILSADLRWNIDPSRLATLQRHLLRHTQLFSLAPEASGLVVFSQQRGTIRTLTENGHKLEQEYVVEVAGEADAHALERLARGYTHRGVSLPKAKASWQNETHLRIALKGPKQDDLRQLCEAVGLRLLGSKRIRIGRVSMAKLPAGQWRYLADNERF
ncbi:RNA pseudouridine synthase [Stutzerimonas azotifigens]|uniref:Dual-specificity RNA pseudouridine synthase RluF n=1 Tax=Stutzerimonas azotifigens TaxID=291995 RepID=A0ABR5YWU9_9GAMM|nr:RNA pseudouridine synthase [Stutzerimonas azotifigens]MBA1272415.1 RNA-binding protein [Stutzerimonas azotifigens]